METRFTHARNQLIELNGNNTHVGRRTIKTSLTSVYRNEIDIPFLHEAIESIVCDNSEIMKTMSEILNLIMAHASVESYEFINERFLMGIIQGISRTIPNVNPGPIPEPEQGNELELIRYNAIVFCNGQRGNFGFPIRDTRGLSYQVKQYMTGLKNHAIFKFKSYIGQYVGFKARLHFHGFTAAFIYSIKTHFFDLIDEQTTLVALSEEDEFVHQLVHTIRNILPMNLQVNNARNFRAHWYSYLKVIRFISNDIEEIRDQLPQDIEIRIPRIKCLVPISSFEVKFNRFDDNCVHHLLARRRLISGNNNLNLVGIDDMFKHDMFNNNNQISYGIMTDGVQARILLAKCVDYEDDNNNENNDSKEKHLLSSLELAREIMTPDTIVLGADPNVKTLAIAGGFSDVSGQKPLIREQISSEQYYKESGIHERNRLRNQRYEENSIDVLHNSLSTTNTVRLDRVSNRLITFLNASHVLFEHHFQRYYRLQRRRTDFGKDRALDRIVNRFHHEVKRKAAFQPPKPARKVKDIVEWPPWVQRMDLPPPSFQQGRWRSKRLKRRLARMRTNNKYIRKKKRKRWRIKYGHQVNDEPPIQHYDAAEVHNVPIHFVVGNWNAPFNPYFNRGSAYLPVRKFCMILSRKPNCWIFTENEYNTSKICNFCFNHGVTSHVQSVQGNYHWKRCPNCDTRWHRDIHAALNIRDVHLHRIRNNGERPVAFQPL